MAGAEQGVERLLGRDSSVEHIGDAEEDFAVAEVDVEGALALAVVEAGQEFGAGGAFGGWDFDGNTAEEGDDGGIFGGVHGGGPEQLLAAAADNEGVAIFGEGGLELPGFEELRGGLEYRVHDSKRVWLLFGV